MSEETPKQNKTNKLSKPIRITAITAGVFFLYFVYILFAPNISPKSAEKTYLCIPDSSSLEQVVILLANEADISNTMAFKQVAALLRYSKIRPGRYEIKSGMNNFQLIRILRSGRQTPVKLTFNNIRTKEQLAGRLSTQLMADSASILAVLNDTALLAKDSLNPNTSIALFIPNTYEVFWDMDAMELYNRMKKEYNSFWTNERKAKAAAIPLTPVQVSTLASIVEEETNGKSERPMVAGLYINRLRIDMPLQADPTLKFAVGDFSIKRLTLEHILKISPYNTYRNHGLPPGPIRVASPNGIDAVLNYVQHKYIFMCAKETLNGEHNFVVTYAEHQANAKKYQKALDDRKIFK